MHDRDTQVESKGAHLATEDMINAVAAAEKRERVARAELDAVLQSSSWKITRPLRELFTRHPRAARTLRHALSLASKVIRRTPRLPCSGSEKTVTVSTRHKPVPQPILQQIKDQASLEPAVLAAGSLALSDLDVFDALDELPRAGVNVRSITTSSARKPNIVLLIPHLMVGGADRYVVDLLDIMRREGKGPILVIVTEAPKADSHNWHEKETFRLYRDETVIFWHDLCGEVYYEPSYLAFFMNYIRPKMIIASNSRLGLEMIVRYGLGLSSFSRLLTTYFSLGLPGLGVTWGTRYARATAPFALAITDNHPTGQRLLDWCRKISGPGVRVIPSRVEAISEARFDARVKARARSACRRSPAKSWLWISRLERLKGTKVLAALATLRPDDTFSVFGPLQEPLGEQGLEQPNVRYGGVLPSVSGGNFDTYDGFVFTSLFEGLPLIALEMSQHAIPMVLADVGGLRDTFDDTSVIFVQQDEDPYLAARAFSSGLDKLEAAGITEIIDMVTRARLHTIKRHGSAAFEQAVQGLLCDQTNL